MLDKRLIMKESLERLDPDALERVFWWFFKDEVIEMLLEYKPDDVVKALKAALDG